MKPGRAHLLALLRLLAISASLVSGMAVADEYSEVSQMLRAGRLAEAQARVDRALAAKPRDPQMRYFKGVIQRESGQTAEALTTFTKLTEDLSGTARALQQPGRHPRRAGRFRQGSYRTRDGDPRQSRLCHGP